MVLLTHTDGEQIIVRKKTETGKYLPLHITLGFLDLQNTKTREMELYYSPPKKSFFSLQGKPRPKIIWMKDGQILDSKDVGIRNSNTDTILFIRKAELHHSGAYEVTLQIENMADKVAITMQIIGKNLTTSKLGISYKTE